MEKLKNMDELEFNTNGFRRFLIIIMLGFLSYCIFSCETYTQVKKANVLHKHIKHEKKKTKI